MRTFEMVKELTYNPEKKFKRKSDGQVVFIENNKLSWEPGIRSIGIYDEWEGVKEPVTFIEVVKAAKEGKTVGVKHDKIEVEYAKWELGDLLSDINHYFDTEDLAEIILGGKWYIDELGDENETRMPNM